MGVAGLLTFEIGLERALVREQHGGFECLVTLSSHCACLGRLTSGNNLLGGKQEMPPQLRRREDSTSSNLNSPFNVAASLYVH